MRRRHVVLVAAFVGLVWAGPGGAAGSAGAAGASANDDDVPIAGDAARPNPVDPSLLPPGFATSVEPANAKAGVEVLRPDGSFGFLPFDSRSQDYGAYRFQLVSSGTDGDIEALRNFIIGVAAELSEITGITFSVDPGQVPRPTSVNRFPPGWCGSFGGSGCSFFDDADLSIGAIRIGFSSGSPCGALVPQGGAQGTVGCGGPESVRLPDGTIVHVRGNVWLSGSLGDTNAALAQDIVAHEVGHALGLDHYSPTYAGVPGVTPIRQLMYPAVHDDPTDTGFDYRTGDLQGIRWLHPAEAWYITATYLDFLGRPPDTAGYQYWVAADVSSDNYVTALATSDEWVGRIVSDFYADVFGRPPDPGGFAYWTAQVRAIGVPLVAAQLYGADEYVARNGGTTTGFVQGMYRDLLGRDAAADPAGVAYWVGQADAGGRVGVADAFFQSDEKRRARVHDLYCTLLDRPPDEAGATYWAGVILAQGDLALARNLATSVEYVASADEYVLAGEPGAATC